MIVTESNFQKVLKILKTQKILFIDTETSGLKPYEGDEVCGIGIGVAGGKEFYLPFRHKHIESKNLSMDCFLKIIELINQTPILVGYNIKFDLHMLVKEGFQEDFIEKRSLVDMIVAVRLIEDERFPKLSLSEVIDRHYGKGSSNYDIEVKEILKENRWKKDFSLSPESILGPYCEKDVYWTRRLYFDVLSEIRRTDQIKIWKIQRKLTKVLFSMERRGIKIDLEYCQEALLKIRDRQKELEKRIYEGFDEKFNINSSQQVGKMFRKIDIVSPEGYSAKGNEKWNEVALMQIDHPIAGFIREYRTLMKMDSTYLSPFLEIPIVHGSFWNWGTVTGRLSSRNPNLQNIPRFLISTKDRKLDELQKKEITERIEGMMRARKGSNSSIGGSTLASWGFTGDENFEDANVDQVSIRRLFISRPGYKLVSFDYSQMEIKVFLFYIKNKEFISLMEKEDFDFHSEAAKIAFGVSEQDPDFGFYRQLAKAITFGVIYGIGIKKLASQLGKTEEETKKYRENYFRSISGSQEFIWKINNDAKKGLIRNKFGRRYILSQGKEYASVNYLIQGTSADILSSRMVVLEKDFKRLQAYPLMQIHDELICEIIDDENIESTVDYIKQKLEENELGMSLKVDIAFCDPSWAHKRKV